MNMNRLRSPSPSGSRHYPGSDDGPTCQGSSEPDCVKELRRIPEFRQNGQRLNGFRCSDPDGAVQWAVKNDKPQLLALALTESRCGPVELHGSVSTACRDVLRKHGHPVQWDWGEIDTSNVDEAMGQLSSLGPSIQCVHFSVTPDVSPRNLAQFLHTLDQLSGPPEAYPTPLSKKPLGHDSPISVNYPSDIERLRVLRDAHHPVHLQLGEVAPGNVQDLTELLKHQDLNIRCVDFTLASGLSHEDLEQFLTAFGGLDGLRYQTMPKLESGEPFVEKQLSNALRTKSAAPEASLTPSLLVRCKV